MFLCVCVSRVERVIDIFPQTMSPSKTRRASRQTKPLHTMSGVLCVRKRVRVQWFFDFQMKRSGRVTSCWARSATHALKEAPKGAEGAPNAPEIKSSVYTHTLIALIGGVFVVAFGRSWVAYRTHAIHARNHVRAQRTNLT